MLVYGALVPHPPIILAAIGGEETKKAHKTVQAMERLAERLAALKLDTVVIFSPHGPVFQDGLAIRGGTRLKGDLARFGYFRKWEWEVDQELAAAISREIKKEKIPCLQLTAEDLAGYGLGAELDHGVLVPLSFLADDSVKLVATGMSLLPWLEQYQLGVAIGRAVHKSPRRIGVIASGDLSHCLKPGAPAPYDPRGKEFDETLMALLQAKNRAAIFDLDPVLVEKAAECGFRTLLMLLGVFDGWQAEIEVLSYEGPFGVGYGVVSFAPRGEDESKSSLLTVLRHRREEALRNRRAAESPFVRVARQTVENYLLGTETAIVPGDLPPEAQEPAGAFVSIKKHGQLRGCIGTVFPTQPTFLEEIRHNAISAALHDPRFEPVQAEELPDLVYSVDRILPPESVAGPADLDPQKYGVIVRSGRKTGLLLPNLEGVETVEEQLAIAKRKAGIGPHEPVELERFEVVRYY
ncbi:MAG TPA: AmmeMemoRadiSam system protein A [Firmicutes bacterium]|nr:AmmeMemoRadiSam system protein A [Bacillota bacterium]